MQDKTPEEKAKTRKSIMDVLDTEVQLRSKKELIERFIAEHFAHLPPSADVGVEFDSYWEAQKQSALITLSESEGLKREALDKVLANYLFTEKTPMRDDVIEIMETRPALRARRSIADRVIEKIKAFVETFIDGVD
jgi:type I restriction enzyme R subunit